MNSEKENKKKNNLREQPIEFFTEKFRESNPEEIAERLQIPFDAEKGIFTFAFMGNPVRVTYPEFTVEPQLKDQGAVILILRYLLFANVGAFNGKFISFRDMPSGDLYIQPFTGRCITRMNFKYGTRIAVFREAMEGIGARRVDYADACYEIELFRQLWVRFIIWEGDEEFPPSSQMLFSENFREAFETYDLAEIGGICLNALGAWEAARAAH